MTQAEFLLDQQARCNKWLDTPEAELPGTLTHAKALELLERTQDELIDHARYCPITGAVSYA